MTCTPLARAGPEVTEQECLPLDPDDIETADETLVTVSCCHVQGFSSSGSQRCENSNRPTSHSVMSEVPNRDDENEEESLSPSPCTTMSPSPCTTMSPTSAHGSQQAWITHPHLQKEPSDINKYFHSKDKPDNRDKSQVTPDKKTHNLSSSCEVTGSSEVDTCYDLTKDFDDSQFDDFFNEIQSPSCLDDCVHITDDIVIEDEPVDKKGRDEAKMTEAASHRTMTISCSEDDEDGSLEEGVHVQTLEETAEELNITDLFDPRITGLLLNCVQLSKLWTLWWTDLFLLFGECSSLGVRLYYIV